MKERRKVALKYCGGCNPGFDRVEYFRKIRSAAGDSIEWITLEDPGVDVVLLIQGCQTACPARMLDCIGNKRIVSIIDDGRDPEEILKNLLRERGE